MYNSYVTSTYTIKCKGSPSFSFNDYCTSCLNEKFYRNPLSYSTYQCCNCCNCGRNVVQNKGGFFCPSYSNGLKQPTSIECCAPNKRAIFNGFDRFYGSRFPGYDDFYERKVCERRLKSGKGKFSCRAAYEEDRERQKLCGGGVKYDEVETILSLLSEDVNVAERRAKANRTIHVDDECENCAIEETASKFKLETRRQREREIQSVRRKEKEKKVVDTGVMGSASKFEYESKRTRSREGNMRKKEGEKREVASKVPPERETRNFRLKKEEREHHLLGENQEARVRKESRHEDQLQKAKEDISRCSSYYSISSGEFKSDDEIQVEQHDDFKRESKMNLDDKQEFKRHGQYSKKSELVTQKDDSDTRFSGRVESSWRKETEKKLTDTSIKEAESSKETSLNKSRNSHSEMDFGSNSKLDHRTEAKTRIKHKHFKDNNSTSESFGDEYENSSTYQKVYNNRDKSLSQDVTKHQELSKTEESKVEEIDARDVSSNYRQSETRMKNLDDHSSRNFYDRKEKHQQVESSVKHERVIEDSSLESIYVSREEIDRRSRKQGKKSSFIYNSSLESAEPHLEGNSITSRIPQYAKPSQEITKISVPFHLETHISIASSSLQPETTSSLDVKPPHGVEIEEISDTTPPLGQQSLQLVHHPQESTKKNKTDGIPIGDTLSSAEHHVDEFLEKAKNEFSSSKVNEKHEIAATVSHKSRVSELEGTVSKRSSLSSRSKGPSDETWHVNEPSIEIPSKEEEALVHEGTSQNVVVKRSGKSLWNVIADIVHFRWARREDHGISSKSVRKTSPNQSTRSEASEKDTITSIKESISVEQPKMVEISSEESSSISSLSLPQDKTNMLSSSGSSLHVTLIDANPKVEEAESSNPLHVDQITSASVSTEQISQLVSIGSSDQISVNKDIETKQRKLLRRTDQVVKDRFEEWEEAYRLEAEQQKFDEMFMREALIEAKKAADIWEVPVGAVLVQDGKIIARGYNLVEDLRDSTAHAEMMCIREASNILRSWRLSGMTLYVTLEPCAMCAGAILQARIDTLVWGAPNKLLGADGSWIRLLPNVEGGGGASGSESLLPDKHGGAPPVHPFHPKMVIRRGILESECSDAMQQFFKRRRRKKEKEKKPEPSAPNSCLPISHHPSKFLSKMHHAFHIFFC